MAEHNWQSEKPDDPRRPKMRMAKILIWVVQGANLLFSAYSAYNVVFEQFSDQPLIKFAIPAGALALGVYLLRSVQKRVGTLLPDTTARAIDTLVAKLRTDAPRQDQPTSAIAAIGQAKRNQQLTSTALLLAAFGLYAACSSYFSFQLSAFVISLLAVAIIAVNISALALEYRVRRGLYGTTEYEAREIIAFALSRGDDIDLSGGLGANELQLTSDTQTSLVAIWSGARA